MSAYVLVDIDVEEGEAFSQYVAKIPDLIAKHDGCYLVRGAEPALVHGASAPQYMAVLAFPTRATAEAFFEERAEAGLADLFAASTRSRILLVDGV